MDLSQLPCSSSSVGPASQLLGLLLQTIFAKQCGIIANWPPDYGTSLVNENEAVELSDYDFIVVGAGSAGSVVANRLSENKDWKILVLEAGSIPPMESEIPLLIYFTLNTQYDWGYYAEKSTFEAISQINGTHLASGKMLGGSSSMNHGVYVRGFVNDFDKWVASGLPLWNWESNLKYFKKSENQKDQFLAQNTKYHSVGGYLPVDHFNYQGDIKYIIRDCYSDINIPEIDDINADQYIGSVFEEGVLNNGRQTSVAEAFLVPIRDRQNLNIIQNARVTTLNYNKDGSVAGVNFILNGTKHLVATAKKEVILSAGALNSPLILLNSGIGPAEELKQFNIGLVRDLAVGYNLQDHLFIPFVIGLYKSSTPQASQLSEVADGYYQYLMTGTGDYSNIGISELNAFINTEINAKFPNIQLDTTFFSKNTQNLQSLLTIFGFEDSINQNLVQINQQADTVLILVNLLNPKSRGVLKLRSNNLLDSPKVYTNYFQEQEDIRTIIKSIRILQQFSNSSTFIQNEGKIEKINLADCDNLVDDSDTYWECYSRHLTASAYHFVGTDKMGPASDREAVVDERLRVHGVKRLRVIDASVMPIIISGNTNAPTIMIAEKGSDFIKQDWLWSTYLANVFDYFLSKAKDFINS